MAKEKTRERRRQVSFVLQFLFHCGQVGSALSGVGSIRRSEKSFRSGTREDGRGDNKDGGTRQYDQRAVEEPAWMDWTCALSISPSLYISLSHTFDFPSHIRCLYFRLDVMAGAYRYAPSLCGGKAKTYENECARVRITHL